MLCTVVLGRGGSEHFAAPQMSKAPNAAQDTGVQWQGSLTRLASMGSNSPMWPPAPGPGMEEGAGYPASSHLLGAFLVAQQ